MSPLFTYDSYKNYLTDYLHSQEKSWGLRSKLCEAMDIHSAYLSQVLGGEKDLNPEQAEKLGRFFSFHENEMDYWLSLVQFNRAGTKNLASHYQKRLHGLRESHLNLVQRLGEKKRITEKDQSIYYSSWHYAALHSAVLISDLTSTPQLARRFRLDEDKVIEVMDFLISIGMIEKQNNKYLSTNDWIRLPKTSPLIIQHHSNIRLKAAQSIQEKRNDELHYGGFFTFAKKDFVTIQDLLLKALKETQEVIKASPSEEVYGICIDAFKL